MPDEQIEENTEESQEQPRKKKGGRKLLIGLLILIMAGGGGGGFYFWRHRAAAKAQAALAASEHKSGKDEKKSGHQGDDAEVKEVIELQPFIVNLADTTETRYLRMTISLGVGESHEEKVDPLYTTRVRNAILATITTKTSDQILTVEGKTELRKEMLQAARATVDEPEVYAIYITDFIVQM